MRSNSYDEKKQREKEKKEKDRSRRELKFIEVSGQVNWKLDAYKWTNYESNRSWLNCIWRWIH